MPMLQLTEPVISTIAILEEGVDSSDDPILIEDFRQIVFNFAKLEHHDHTV